MKNRYNVIKAFSIILLSITAIEVTIYIVLATLKLFDQIDQNYDVLFAVLTPAIFVILILVLSKYFEYRIIFRSLKKENLHYLGEESTFNNLTLFKKQINILPDSGEETPYYMVVFTPCSQIVTNNITTNSIIIKYNGLISRMIDEYFKENKRYRFFDAAYCFSRNSFVMLIRGNENRINEIIKQFETNLYDIARINEIRIFVQPFFGVTMFTPGEDIDIAIENAIVARLQSENNFELSTYFNKNLLDTSLLDETKDILEGLQNKEFVVYYQPKFNLENRRFISSEALIRWNSKKFGFLNPGQFIEKAEKAGLIHEIDMYVFKKVCEDLNDSIRRGRRAIPVSINFSLYEFFSPNFITDIVGIIDENKVPHHLIEIEITETTSQSNPFLSISIMKQLKSKGLRVLMDDFGVGYSNFSNLRKMPIDAIKIDKSFIDIIESDKKTEEIVKFLINLGKVNGLEVIAEGVDNRNQVEILRRAHLDTIQGYFYSKPLSKKDYDAFLITNTFEKKGETK